MDDSNWTSPYMNVPPQWNNPATVTAGELARWREVEQLARELAAQIARLAILCDEDELGEFYCCDLCKVRLVSAIQFIHLDACLIARARKMGLIE